ncbi:MAG: hypothetical protein QNK05_25915 [Myxococcota bacterium]|nr:hypothetical protein [Myxococcota bacterium]
MKAISRGALLALFLMALLGCGRNEGPWFIPGSAELPDCDDPPAFDLDGTTWFDTGEVEIQTAGCSDAMPGDTFDVCALSWEMTVTEPGGNDVRILVDNEYRILGRLCGATLYLEGGWWLPVEDEGLCTYDEDSAEEVGIEDGGSTLNVTSGLGGLEATGVLIVRGACEATYDMTLRQL